MIRLCSTSETRAKILDSFSVKYIQSSIDFDEDSIKETDAKSFVYSVVKGKISSALNLYNLDLPLLVADTVIESSDGEILRKAKNSTDAIDILLKQSRKSISIITAVILKTKNQEFIDISNTKYCFNEFELEDLYRYIESDQWRGKAGACMVEGFCKKYIDKVIGLETTAMGLQIEKILPWVDFRDDND